MNRILFETEYGLDLIPEALRGVLCLHVMDDTCDLMINRVLHTMKGSVQSSLEVVKSCCDRFVIQARVQFADFGRGRGKKLAAVMAERHAVFQCIQARDDVDVRFTHWRNSFTTAT